MSPALLGKDVTEGAEVHAAVQGQLYMSVAPAGGVFLDECVVSVSNTACKSLVFPRKTGMFFFRQVSGEDKEDTARPASALLAVLRATIIQHLS